MRCYHRWGTYFVAERIVDTANILDPVDVEVFLCFRTCEGDHIEQSTPDVNSMNGLMLRLVLRRRQILQRKRKKNKLTESHTQHGAQ